MTHLYPDLGSASDMLQQISHAARSVSSTTQRNYSLSEKSLKTLLPEYQRKSGRYSYTNTPQPATLAAAQPRTSRPISSECSSLYKGTGAQINLSMNFRSLVLHKHHFHHGRMLGQPLAVFLPCDISGYFPWGVQMRSSPVLFCQFY